MTDRQKLIDQCSDRRRLHQPSAFLQRKLIKQTTQEIAEIERIERLVVNLQFAVDAVIEAHNDAPAYLAKNSKELNDAYTRLSFLVSAIQIKPMEAAE